MRGRKGDLLSVPKRLSGLDFLVGCSLGKGRFEGHFPKVSYTFTEKTKSEEISTDMLHSKDD